MKYYLFNYQYINAVLSTKKKENSFLIKNSQKLGFGFIVNLKPVEIEIYTLL